MDNKKNKISFSVYSYFAATVIAVIIFFGSFALIVQDRGSSLKQNILEVNHTTINQELQIALKQIQRELEEIRQPLVEWDEVRQQLNNSKYYSYWYQNRLKPSTLLPEFIDEIELYNKNRQILQWHPSDIKKHLFTENMLGMTASLRNNRIKIGYGFPIAGKADRHPHGYIYIEADLLHSIRFQYALNPEQIAMIQHDIRADEIIPYRDLSTRLNIPRVETEESLELGKLIESVQHNLFLSGLIISIFFWILIVYLFARPLLGLSGLIDRLRKNDIPEKDYSPSVFRVTEIEKTRSSLLQLHNQLRMRNSELITNEKQLRTILDNVPDGVISVLEDDIIFSCNPAASRLFKMTTEDLIGKHLSDFVTTDKDNELLGRRSDKSTFPAEMTFSKTIAENDTRIVIVRDISERKDNEAKLIQLANYDPLTNLPNRTLMRDRLNHAIQIAQRNESRIGLMFLDLDRFKNFNDTLGHQIGDTLLIEVARRLQQTVRQSDTVARLGGDEFTVILENIPSNDELTEIAANILHAIRQPMQLAGREINVTTSIGITVYPTDDSDPQRLIKNADTAMYRAKELGGDNYQYFTDDMNIRAMEHLELENQLRHALQNDEFVLHYQPRIDMNHNRTVGAEVLVRWQKSEQELVYPGTFIPNAEDTGLIIPLGQWILEKTCRQICEWQKQNIQVPRLSVNISPRQFHEPNFMAMVEDILKRTGVSPELLEFEITEGMIMDNTEGVIGTLQQLRELGIVISLDDFGTGYSSLSYLKRLPIDIIKIDRSFVADIPDSEDACSIVNAIIALSIGLKHSVIAEGIETEAQARYLLASGCNECQGYLYARPMPARDFQQRLCATQTDHPGATASLG